MNARRLALVLVMASAALVGGCSRKGQIADGGVYVTRSTCPVVGVVAGTGDVTTFDPAESRAAAAIDVVATITTVRNSCTDDGITITSTATFNVLANRRDAGAARQVVLPYYNVVMQGGSSVIAKQVSAVGLDFAAGSQRAQTSGRAVVRVSKAAATLPADIQKLLTKPRKAGDADAAIDPLTVPTTRAAVARASFEHLVGFQITPEQLRFNATR